MRKLLFIFLILPSIVFAQTKTFLMTDAQATVNQVAVFDASAHVVGSFSLNGVTVNGVAPTEFNFLDATSSIQSQLNLKLPSSTFTAANIEALIGSTFYDPYGAAAARAAVASCSTGQYMTGTTTSAASCAQIAYSQLSGLPSLGALAAAGFPSSGIVYSNGNAFGAATSAQLQSAIGSSVYDAYGAASSALTSAQTFSANASNLSSGTIPSARLAGSYSGITAVGTLTAGSIPYSLLTGTPTIPSTTTQITEGASLYFTNARAIGAVLTGYSSSPGTVAATDSVLTAIQKLNGNEAALAASLGSAAYTASSAYDAAGAAASRASVGACSTNQFSIATTTSGLTCAQVTYSQIGGAVPTWNQNTTGTAAISNQLNLDGGGGSAFHWVGASGQPTWLWGGNGPSDMYVYNPANFNVAYAVSATSASSSVFSSYLSTNYIGGQQLNPQTYFSNGIGLKVAMTGAAGVWTDTLWINGYSGSDVKNMVALHTSRQGTPRLWLSTQSDDATSYGTLYEVLSTYNLNSYVPTLTGAGASGTWSINVTGNAATASALSNFHVGLATDLSTNLNNVTTSGMYRIAGSETNQPAGTNNYGQLLVMHGGADTITQIYGDYATGILYTRAGAPPSVGGAGAWSSWSALLDTTHNSYAANMDQNVRTSDSPSFAGLYADRMSSKSTGTIIISPTIYTYFNSGSVYVDGLFYARGGIVDDTHSYLTIYGSSAGGNTYFPNYVGFGVTTPLSRLSVAGASSGLSDTGIVQIAAGTGANTDDKLIFGVDSINNFAWIFAAKPGSDAIPLILGSISGNSRVGIGTSSPAQKLEVNGNIQGDGDIYLGTRGVWLSGWLNQSVRTNDSPSFAALNLAGSQKIWLGSSGANNYIESGNSVWNASSPLVFSGYNGNATTFTFLGDISFSGVLSGSGAGLTGIASSLTAGSALALDTSHVNYDANTMPSGRTGYTTATNAPFNGPIFTLGTVDYPFQFNATAVGKTQQLGVTDGPISIAVRTQNSDFGWNAWTYLVTGDNIGTYLNGWSPQFYNLFVTNNFYLPTFAIDPSNQTIAPGIGLQFTQTNAAYTTTTRFAWSWNTQFASLGCLNISPIAMSGKVIFNVTNICTNSIVMPSSIAINVSAIY